MKSFKEECSDLALLQTFNPEAFAADEKTTQEVCNLVLSLALIYNDCKDTIYAHTLLHQSTPEGLPGKSRLWGAHSGANFHLFRIHIALLHELFELIRRSRNVLEDEFFRSVVKKLGRNAREAWEDLVEVALGGKPSREFAKSLLLIRNKVSFHYDAKEIFKGYRQHFLGPGRVDERAFISRGLSMSESRLYFADASAQGYLRSLIGKEETEKLLRNVSEVLGQVNLALMQIVDQFILKRGFAYRDYSEK